MGPVGHVGGRIGLEVGRLGDPIAFRLAHQFHKAIRRRIAFQKRGANGAAFQVRDDLFGLLVVQLADREVMQARRIGISQFWRINHVQLPHVTWETPASLLGW